MGKRSGSSIVISGIAVIIAMLFFAIPVQSQVYVGGEITFDQIYSPDNNPYIVTQDLVITQDVTLTIMPGVELLFEYGTGIVNNGTLVAKGESGQKIRFLPKEVSTLLGQWNGIVFNHSKTILDTDSMYVSGSILSETIINNASYSVTLSNNTSLLTENTIIDRCSFGIYIMESGSNTIRNCTFTNCNFGIFFANGFLNPENKIYRNTISGCSEVGVFINSSSTQSNHNFILDNAINSCNIGLHIGNFGNNGSGYNVIAGNSFSGNKDAVKLFQNSNTLKDNYFKQNRSGIICWQSDYNTITRNLFTRNVLNAITLAAGSSFNNITYNGMNFNSGGVWIKPDSSRNSLYNSFLYNTIYKNTDFSLQVLNSPQGPVQFNNIGLNGDLQSFKNLADSIIHAEYNYWGSVATDGIDSIIYDMYDLSALGEVFYKPMLDNILSTAPVPPPDKVIKQRVGNDLVVSWEAESISDLQGYNVHSGMNNGYVFEHVVDNGLSTFLNLGPLALEDTVAVTAFDHSADGNHDQTDGYESDFSFAILAPYAGPDTAICFDSEYLIQKATAFNYISLSWSTTGDGSFSAVNVLNPVYIPGPLDYSYGSVTLNLTLQNAEDQINDAAHITFHAAPEVFAGNDTIINTDSTLWIINAHASGFYSLKWISTGDGTFNSDTLTDPVYFPGPGDLSAGTVTLSVTAFSSCGATTDQLILTIDPGFTVTGRVHSGSVLAQNSTLKLFQVKDISIKPFRSGLISPDGNFEIKALLGGSYYLYIEPDKENTPGYLPTYFFNDIHWENAYKLQVDANIYDVDIDLARMSLQFPQGEGSILGFCAALPGNAKGCGDVTVFLYDKQMKNILDWVMVRNSSDFRFKNLPYGDYKLSGESAGRQIFNSDVITLSPSQPIIENIELICSAAGYKFSVPGYANPDVTLGEISIYPNPVTDKLYFNGLSGNGTYTVRLINSQGLVQKYFVGSDGINSNILLLNSLPSGFYIIEVYNEGTCLLRNKLLKN